MYDTIVVPVDGSETALRALPVADRLARTFGARVRLASVISPGIDRLAAEVKLGGLVEDLGLETLPPLVLSSNDVAGALRDHVRAQPSTLLCLATHGRGALAAAVIGSTAAALLDVAEMPLVLVGPRCEPGAVAHLVVGVEVSPAVETQLPVVSGWARGTRATVHLVNVITDVEAIVVGEHAACSYMSGLAAAARAVGMSADWKVLQGDDIGPPLCAVAAELGDAVVVVGGTRPGHGLGRLALGSVAQHVVRRATCPVLVVPASTTREET